MPVNKLVQFEKKNEGRFFSKKKRYQNVQLRKIIVKTSTSKKDDEPFINFILFFDEMGV